MGFNRQKNGTIQPRPAFTLIEVLVVVAIIALLVSILMPSLARARAQAKTAVCASHQKQLASIQQLYAIDHKSYLPGVDLWLAARLSGGLVGATYDLAPDTGELFGNRPTPTVPNRRPTRNYTMEKEIYKCPTDTFDRAVGGSPPITQTFSYTRNSAIVYALGVKTSGSGLYEEKYLNVDSVKFSSEAPLMVEEYEFSPFNDGELQNHRGDVLTMRHGGSVRPQGGGSIRHVGRAVLSYHDGHVDRVMSELYNYGTDAYRHAFMCPGL
jgi:prepilin-type N-terminal cleavage/methylation domain-containing protein